MALNCWDRCVAIASLSIQDKGPMKGCHFNIPMLELQPGCQVALGPRSCQPWSKFKDLR